MDFSQIWFPLLLATFAGLATVIGNLICFCIKSYKKVYLSFFLGMSGGVMIYISLVELLPDSIEDVGFLGANLAFFGGILVIMAIDFLVPHEYIQEKSCGKFMKKHDRRLMSAGILTALGIAIHNFPEGMAVVFSSLESLTLGISLAIAIAIHNIPEGIAVSMPIYCATKSRKKAFGYSLLAGVAEPIGALLALLFFYPFLNEHILSYILALVAGIMVFISFDELLPLSFGNRRRHVSVIGVLCGMIIIALSLFLL
ncbi:MAG: zinc transporter ZupT [Patescibacteria group bacterium]